MCLSNVCLGLQMGINFINPDKQTGEKDFSVIGTGDVVVLPAFGASLEEMQVCAVYSKCTCMLHINVFPSKLDSL